MGLSSQIGQCRRQRAEQRLLGQQQPHAAHGGAARGFTAKPAGVTQTTVVSCTERSNHG